MNECDCGSDNIFSARYGHPHIPWCKTQQKTERCDLECGNRIATGHKVCRHGRTPDEMMGHLR